MTFTKLHFPPKWSKVESPVRIQYTLLIHGTVIVTDASQHVLLFSILMWQYQYLACFISSVVIFYLELQLRNLKLYLTMLTCAFPLLNC